MAIEILETVIGWLGGVLALVTLATIFYGIYRGAIRQPGRQVGSATAILRSIPFYILASVIFFGICFLLWRPLPLVLSLTWRVTAFVLGSLLYFPAMGFVLWGRLVLGGMYFVSTGMGAQLFSDHRLVTNGPFAIVRHPMYLGLSVAVLGGLLLYQTWTMVVLLILPFGLARRARREEQALAAEFGEEWKVYCLNVPALFPRLTKKGS